MGKKGWLTLIILLLIGGAIFAIVISAPKKDGVKTGSNSPAPAPAPVAPSPAPAIKNAAGSEELISGIPVPGSSIAAVEAYAAKVAAVSQAVASVEINNCAPTPNIVSAKTNGTIILKNNDAEAHVISYPVNGVLLDPGTSSSAKVTVPAKGEYALTFSGIVRGIYGFACDPETKKGAQVGIFNLTK